MGGGELMLNLALVYLLSTHYTYIERMSIDTFTALIYVHYYANASRHWNSITDSAIAVIGSSLSGLVRTLPGLSFKDMPQYPVNGHPAHKAFPQRLYIEHPPSSCVYHTPVSRALTIRVNLNILNIFVYGCRALGCGLTSARQ